MQHILNTDVKVQLEILNCGLSFLYKIIEKNAYSCLWILFIRYTWSIDEFMARSVPILGYLVMCTQYSKIWKSQKSKHFSIQTFWIINIEATQNEIGRK
jgi:hypothetical protein